MRIHILEISKERVSQTTRSLDHVNLQTFYDSLLFPAQVLWFVNSAFTVGEIIT